MSNSSTTTPAVPAASVPEGRLTEEDGWLFRERPGIPIECIGRAKKGAEMTPPNENRHNYPSA